MPKGKKTDLNQLAASIVAQATGDHAPKGKNAAAVALGRLGGLKGGKARAAKVTPRQRKEMATNAAKARWSKSHKPG